MKRDARIGLAVVLVLGLGVTLLVGRAIYKRGGAAADSDGESFAMDGTQQNARAETNPSEASLFGTRDDSHAVGGGSLQPGTPGALPPGAQGFVDDQTRGLESPDHLTAGPILHESVGTAGEPHLTQPLPAHPQYYVYVATSGDSPWTVSSKVFGDGKYTQKIVEANDLTSKKIKPGMLLKIPAIPNKTMIMKLQPFAEPGAAHTAKPAPANTIAENHTGATAKATYKVETGDTLSTIAKKRYGNNGPKTIQLIVTANHGLDPAKLKVGQEIALPTQK